MGSGIDKAACENTSTKCWWTASPLRDARMRPEAVDYDVLPGKP